LLERETVWLVTPAVPAVNAAILNEFVRVSAGDSRELVNDFVFGERKTLLAFISEKTNGTKNLNIP
jgi:hypothetical protein